MIIPAPIAGTVLAKTALEGMMFRPGDPLFSLADLSVVAVIWAIFQFLNIAWPRDFYGNWLNWSIYIVVGSLLVIGAVIYAAMRPRMTTFPTFEVDDPEDDAETRTYLAGEQSAP